MDPHVGIVIVNWNKANDLIQLLESVKNIDYRKFQIFVVDNASTDDSIERIKNWDGEVDLLINKVNLGGTGGFNSGIRYALQKGQFKYIWLLDNDATVAPNALSALVESMETDEKIGLAGSRVINAQDPEFIVETGANFNWKKGTVAPIHRNMKKESVPGSDPISVDYVAVCSALVRVSALPDVGLMDERYFLFWDDMDWGIAFQTAGYKVVAVPASEVMHPAFTEKRNIVVDSYYGTRNSLLAFSKYLHIPKASIGILNQLRCLFKSSLLFCLGKNSSYLIGLSGFKDFMIGRWGKYEAGLNYLEKGIDEDGLNVHGKVLLLPLSSYKEITPIIDYVQENKCKISSLEILVAEDRFELFKNSAIDNLITINYLKRNDFIENFRIFCKVWSADYHIAVKTSNEKITPFSFAVRSVGYFDEEKRKVIQIGEGRKHVWKIILAAGLGDIAAILLFPIVLSRALYLMRTR